MFTGRLGAAILTLVAAEAVLGLHFNAHPSGNVQGYAGSPLVLTCTVLCSQSQSCGIGWMRALPSSGQALSVLKFTKVPSIYFSKIGLIYPTYTSQNKLKDGSEEIVSKLVIQSFSSEYAGTYKCRAQDQNHRRTIYSPPTLVQSSLADHETTPNLVARGCSVPAITDFMAQLDDNSRASSTICVKITWNHSRRNRWCKTTKWTLMHASWSQSPSSDSIEDFSDLPSSAKQLKTVSSNLSEAIVCGLDRTQYHKFQLRIQLRRDRQTSLKYNSHVYFFQHQMPARVISASRTISVKHGDEFTIQCQVDGSPKPSVTLMSVLTGDHPIGRPDTFGSRSTTEIYSPQWHNITVNSRIFQKESTSVLRCTASNTLHNPPWGADATMDYWNIHVNVD